MTVRLARLAAICVGFLLAADVSHASAQQSAASEPSLYHRLGGYDVIAATVDEFLKRFDADPQLAPFLGGINASAGARIRQHFVDFICARTGGPCLYNGRDMKATHDGLPIAAAHFVAVMRHFRGALDHLEVPPRPKEELISLLQMLEADVVRQ